jgi:hypothetical protein
MDVEQHARVLYAYIARLKTIDLANIAAAEAEVDYASMNLGLNAQCDAQRKSLTTIQDAITNIWDYDRNNIQRIIEKSQ